jgi:hypothetical protein
MVSVDISASSVQLGKLYRLSCMQQTIVIFKRVNKIAKATISFFMSVCPVAWNNSALTGRIFMEFEDFSKIYRENSSSIKIEQE